MELHCADDEKGHQKPALKVPVGSRINTAQGRLDRVREVVLQEAHALELVAGNLTDSAVEAAEAIARCQGRVIFTGVGKAGWVAQKLSATTASTGTPSHYLHPTEAVHGDFGRLASDDLVIALSHSGSSEELVRIAGQLREMSAGLIAITSTEENPLASSADLAVAFGKQNEACPLGLAPTTSTTAMMAVGDSIAMLASELRQFAPEDFGRIHPGGALGLRTTTVDQHMRKLSECRVASSNRTIRECMVATSRVGRRSGAIMIVDERGGLVGIFTDSDLARLLERRVDDCLDWPVSKCMTRSPKTIGSDAMLHEAATKMGKARISELPVVSQDGRPEGMVDITDLMALGLRCDGEETVDSNPPSLKVAA
ncbi:MAG: KpsF/GutQ family sugar-phosphate isomerase [Planctomycetota bacterium]